MFKKLNTISAGLIALEICWTTTNGKLRAYKMLDMLHSYEIEYAEEVAYFIDHLPFSCFSYFVDEDAINKK